MTSDRVSDERLKWDTEVIPGHVTVHSLVVDGVLCRWWGDQPPKGVAILNAALSRPSQNAEVGVRKLEWHQDRFGHSAESAFGVFWVRNPFSDGKVELEGPFGHSTHDGAGEAKASAQSQVEQRILSSLSRPNQNAEVFISRAFDPMTAHLFATPPAVSAGEAEPGKVWADGVLFDLTVAHFNGKLSADEIEAMRATIRRSVAKRAPLPQVDEGMRADAKRLVRQLAGRARSNGARSYTQRMAEDDFAASVLISALLAALTPQPGGVAKHAEVDGQKPC